VVVGLALGDRIRRKARFAKPGSSRITMPLPEHNVTGIDYSDRAHFAYHGQIIDIHAHVLRTRPDDPPHGPAKGVGPGASMEQAEIMLAEAERFGIVQTVTMCFPDDVEPLRARFGDRLLFNTMVNKQKLDEPDDEVFRRLERCLELGTSIIKFWSAPRGRDRGLFVDAPWRIEAAKRARAAGVRIIMVHVGDPDVWFRTTYADAAKYGTKPEQYIGLERMLELFPDMLWIGAHMGGDSEHPDHLAALLEKYPHFHLDTSATKWQVREVSQRTHGIRELICRFPDRFLFGTDLVTRHGFVPEHYVSRYWCQRTLWESTWEGPSPIADPDWTPPAEGPALPVLRGVGLPADMLGQVYYGNARRMLGSSTST
jgi:predicted TIM-barrel fold metal-dependent hydrolase